MPHGYVYLHDTRHASYSNGQVRGTSGQEVPASDGEDSSPSFGPSLGGHPHDKWVLKKEKTEERKPYLEIRHCLNGIRKTKKQTQQIQENSRHDKNMFSETCPFTHLLSTCYTSIPFLPETQRGLYLIAERLAGQAELPTAHFNRHVANLLPAAGFGLAHDPESQTTLAG